MGERGPRPTIVQRLAPARRVELDEAIIDGRKPNTELYEEYGKTAGISYRAFCSYANQLEARAKHRYVGELLNNVFGNLPDSDIDVRARGIMVAMLDRIAADVLQDGDLKTRDMRDIVQSLNLIRRGKIAEAQEKRRQAEWEVLRMAGVAQAATWIKRELAAQVGEDEELRRRLDEAVDRCCARIDKPAEERVSASLLKQIGRKWNWKRDCYEMVKMIWGIDLAATQDGADGVAQPLTDASVRQQIRDTYNMGPEAGNAGSSSGSPSRGEVYDAVDGFMRGKVAEDDLD